MQGSDFSDVVKSPILAQVWRLARLAHQLDARFAETAFPIGLDNIMTQLETRWHTELAPALPQVGLSIAAYEALTPQQQRQLRRTFLRHIFPLLTPLAIDAAHPFPYISHLSLNLAVVLYDSHQHERYARVKLPRFVPRLLPITWNGNPRLDVISPGSSSPGTPHVWIEEVVAANLNQVFPAFPVIVSSPFRVTRMAQKIANNISGPSRRYGPVVRLELTHTCPSSLCTLLMEHLQVTADQVHVSHGPLGLSDVIELIPAVDRRHDARVGLT